MLWSFWIYKQELKWMYIHGDCNTYIFFSFYKFFNYNIPVCFLCTSQRYWANEAQFMPSQLYCPSHMFFYCFYCTSCVSWCNKWLSIAQNGHNAQYHILFCEYEVTANHFLLFPLESKPKANHFILSEGYTIWMSTAVLFRPKLDGSSKVCPSVMASTMLNHCVFF